MSSSSSSSSWSVCDVCDDDAMAEILVRLPSKSMLRCRAVCKAWRRITTDRSFLAAHSARRPLEMITLGSTASPWTVNAVSVSLRPTPPPPPPPQFHRGHSLVSPDKHMFAVLYSLDGLLLLQQHPGRLYIVCNPITRQWTDLPALPLESPYDTAFTCGFYSHGPSGEYRLLCHALLQPEATDWESRKKKAAAEYQYQFDHYYYILSTGTGGLGQRQPQPRRLGAAPRGKADSPLHRFTQQYEVPVAHRGALHWFPVHPEASSSGTGRMLAFDTVAETFRLMAGPPQERGETTNMALALLELDGGEELGVAAMQAGQFPPTPTSTSVAIWALQDYEAETWTLRHRVEVPLTYYGNIVVKHACRAVSVGAGGGAAVLIGDPFRHDFSSHVLRLYHLRDKRLISHIFLGPCTKPMFMLFRESCVSHAFFDSPRSPRCADINFLYQGQQGD